VNLNGVRLREFLCFRSGVDEASFFLGYDAASRGAWFPTFRGNIVVSPLKVSTS
jgi:hypothetical protein